MAQLMRRKRNLLCSCLKRFGIGARSASLFLMAGAFATIFLLSSQQKQLQSFSLRWNQLTADDELLQMPGLSGRDGANQTDATFAKQYQRVLQRMNASMYRFDKPGLLLPLMRLSKAERSRAVRVAAGRAWLASQSVVIAATVRNGMAGLPSSMRNIRRLRALFNASWLVFVENDSTDSTRGYLYNMTLTDPAMRLLGCGQVNSPLPCQVNIRYGSGRKHVPGYKYRRSLTEEIERGLVMSALRNQYLDYIYEHLAHRASLLLIIDPDLSWADWDLDNIAQGAYYFSAKPRLQQLCAHSTIRGLIYDPCTLSFHLNKRFGEDKKYPVVSYEKSLGKAPFGMPPVKVESCFQAFSFYRMPDLANRRLNYERSLGEWICEHNTLSRQLGEVYLDPQMRLHVTDENAV